MTPTTTPGGNDEPVDPTAAVPEADAAEQATPAVPETTDHTEDRRDETDEVDQADAWEQTLPVPGQDDDDYDYRGGPGSRD
ncbi:hypothetical protein [Segeticoccus rhizosphaerae]|jgi:hypothetical protein|uniref:hypothetical protein n=1 Tax=Segeticoccus rhizosphaerae TaxID=1104777 RepID=UPI0010BF75AF|nr:MULTISPECIES: hypothetical protein [Intrasporangiaceae]